MGCGLSLCCPRPWRLLGDYDCVAGTASAALFCSESECSNYAAGVDFFGLNDCQSYLHSSVETTCSTRMSSLPIFSTPGPLPLAIRVSVSSQYMIAPSTAPPYGMLRQLSSIVQISPAYLDFPLFYLSKLLAPPWLALNLSYALLPFYRSPPISLGHPHPQLRKAQPLPAVSQLS